jgi:hypothetical protein
LRIESPLERQSYRASSTCISRWFLAVPPANPQSEEALPKARRKFEPVMERWHPQAQDVFTDIPKLRTWLLASNQSESSAALVVVSHHDKNALYFDQNERVISEQVQRRFDDTSLLILDGCSTGSPVAIDLLRQFNQRGVAATIATHTAIRPELAGDFLATLDEVLVKTNDAQPVTLADLFFRTLQELRVKKADDTSDAYGPRVLVFSLLGNGGVRLCSPRKVQP